VSVGDGPDVNQKLVVLGGEECGVFVIHPFDGEYEGVTYALDLDLTGGDVGVEEMRVKPEADG
jgi:hypothetical protein